MNPTDSMLRFTRLVSLAMLWAFWVLVFLSAAVCAAVFFKAA